MTFKTDPKDNYTTWMVILFFAFIVILGTLTFDKYVLSAEPIEGVSVLDLNVVLENQEELKQSLGIISNSLLLDVLDRNCSVVGVVQSDVNSVLVSLSCPIELFVGSVEE